MRIVKSYNKANGVTYVYEVTESKWNSEKKRAENVRKMIGHIDEATGEIVPNGKRGRKKKETSKPQPELFQDTLLQQAADEPDYKELYSEASAKLLIQEKEISRLRSSVDELKAQVTHLKEMINSIKDIVSGTRSRSV